MYTFLLYLCVLVTVNLPYHITLCKDFVSFIVLIEKAVYIGLLSVENFFIKFDFVIVFVLLFSLIVSVLCFVSSFFLGGGGRSRQQTDFYFAYNGKSTCRNQAQTNVQNKN